MKNSINQLRLEILNDIKKIEAMSNVKKNKFEKIKQKKEGIGGVRYSFVN